MFDGSRPLRALELILLPPPFTPVSFLRFSSCTAICWRQQEECSPGVLASEPSCLFVLALIDLNRLVQIEVDASASNSRVTFRPPSSADSPPLLRADGCGSHLLPLPSIREQFCFHRASFEGRITLRPNSPRPIFFSPSIRGVLKTSFPFPL